MLAVDLSAVERLEACDDYVALHSGGRQYLVHARLQDMAARLDPRRFVRIHRSHVVNLDFVASIEPHEGSRAVAVLKSGARIASSRAGSARLKSRTS
jgi:DNA-binding LytR/AlgR family response regulator